MEQPTIVAYQESDIPVAVLFRHHLWANLRLIDACMGLTDEQLGATTTGTYGTIYDTWTHMVRSEQNYLTYLTGEQPEVRLRREDRPDLFALRANALQSGSGLIAIAFTVTQADIAIIQHDDGCDEAPASLILLQAINHATEHRAQIMTIMTQLGIEPPNLDGWAYGDDYMFPKALE